MSDGTICGLAYTAVKGKDPKHFTKVWEKRKNGVILVGKVEAKAGTRYHVEHCHHPKGAPIRFKSLERAERHIRNMRLETAAYLNGGAR